MATPTPTSEPAGPSNGPEPATQQNTASAEQVPGPAKKLTGPELKAQKQAEKAKRRAQAIAAKEAGTVQAAPAQSTSTASDSKAGKQKVKHERASSSGGTASTKPTQGRPAVAGVKAALAASPPKAEETDPRDVIPECFSHLSMARRIPISEADKDIHPAVLAVGQQMAAFALRDNIARLEATLLAFKKVVEAYETPPGNAFSRHFMSQVLNPQIDYLTECRPMCFAMGNAIRLLKTKITLVSLEMSDTEASDFICDFIENFIHERIRLAEVAVLRIGRNHIQDGDTILTYCHSRLVRKLLEKAWSEGVKFKVIILDDIHDRTGQELAGLLVQLGVQVTYAQLYPHLGGLTYHLSRATKVLLGTEAVFANGALYGPAGTSDIALAATSLRKPVIALSESINIDRDRVATDSVTYNEIDPEQCSADSFRLLFDTTRDSYVSYLVTEYEESSGKTPSLSVQAVLRAKEEITA